MQPTREAQNRKEGRERLTEKGEKELLETGDNQESLRELKKRGVRFVKGMGSFYTELDGQDQLLLISSNGWNSA
jgi:hypothetical protein